MLTDRQRQIIEWLQQGPCTSRGLATTLKAPPASVRRAIQSLRTQGFDIQFADGSYLQLTANDGWDDVA